MNVTQNPEAIGHLVRHTLHTVAETLTEEGLWI